jgi:hypothetical protein
MTDNSMNEKLDDLLKSQSKEYQTANMLNPKQLAAPA